MSNTQEAAALGEQKEKFCRKYGHKFTGGRCNECTKITKAAYRAKNIEKIKLYEAAYRKEKGRALKCYDKEYRAAHPPKNPKKYKYAARKDLIAAYRINNQEKIRASKKAWQSKESTLEQRRIQKHNRDARLKAGGKLSPGIAKKLLALQKGKCANCKVCVLKKKYHLDHITPVALGGSNTDDNIQILCQFCNLQKHALDPIEWAQKQGRLL